MASITQDLRFKQAVIEYSFKHGVTRAATRYKRTRQWIYFWRRRYDGSIHSLEELSRRPRGYARSLSSLYRVMQREGYFAERSKKKPKYIPKPYTQMTYPGERIQVDVKYVPQACTQAMGKGTRLYQFTAIDEYSRKRYLEGFSDNSSYSASIFARNAARYFGFKIECIQTDNGQEFTQEFTKTFSSRYAKGEELQPTLFQTVLRQMGIRHKQIRPYTPRHNGKVERSHRKDGEWFYAGRKFYSLEDYNKQLKRYMNEYNNFPMRPLNWLSPNEYLASFFSKQSVTNV